MTAASPGPAPATPGQAVFEAWSRAFDGLPVDDWERDLSDSERADWEAAAQAAIAAAPHAVEAAIREMATEQFGDAIRAGTDRLLAEKLPEIQAAARTAPAPELPKTLGQAAYEAFYAGTECGVPVPWAELTDWNEHWNAAAQAAIGAAEDWTTMLIQRDEARAELAAVRQRLTQLAASLYESAGATAPSKKSQIERNCADRVREVLAGLDGA